MNYIYFKKQNNYKLYQMFWALTLWLPMQKHEYFAY